METNRNNKLSLGIVIGILISVVFILVGYIIYDKFLINDGDNQSVKEETDKEEDNDNIVDNEIEINYELVDVKVDMFNFSKLIVNDKDTKLVGGMNNINRLYDAIIFNYSDSISPITIYIVDKNAKIINSFVGNNYINIKEPFIKTKGGTIRDGYNISDNSVYIKSDNLEQDPEAVVCKLQDTEVVKYTEQFRYLGNGKFSDSIIVDTTTVKQYKENNKMVCDYRFK